MSHMICDSVTQCNAYYWLYTKLFSPMGKVAQAVRFLTCFWKDPVRIHTDTATILRSSLFLHCRQIPELILSLATVDSFHILCSSLVTVTQ